MRTTQARKEAVLAACRGAPPHNPGLRIVSRGLLKSSERMRGAWVGPLVERALQQTEIELSRGGDAGLWGFQCCADAAAYVGEANRTRPIVQRHAVIGAGARPELTATGGGRSGWPTGECTDPRPPRSAACERRLSCWALGMIRNCPGVLARTDGGHAGRAAGASCGRRNEDTSSHRCRSVRGGAPARSGRLGARCSRCPPPPDVGERLRAWCGRCCWQAGRSGGS